MPALSSHKDVDALTLTFVSEFSAPVERLWQVWADPRQLERWWGPPTYPATFTRHEFTAGGRCDYFMTSPDGDRSFGWWRVISLEPPRRLVFEDGFANADGTPDDTHGSSTTVVTLEPVGPRTRMTIVGQFTSAEQLEQMVKMGMEEGLTLAIGQIDAILD